MILADAVNQMEVWMLVGQLIMAAGTIGTLIYMVVASNKKTDVRFHQPVSVTITEELHKTFAAKADFDAHVRKNQDDTLEVFREINRLKAENLQMTKDIGQITNQTLAVLANAQKVLHS